MDGVSVIIPCYNGAMYLRQCLESVLAQDFGGLVEVIVADDGSTDESEAVARGFSPRVTFLPCPGGRGGGASHGCGAARNRAIEVSSMPLVALLDCDDLWLPGHLSNLAMAMAARPDVGMACDNGYYISESGKIIGSIISESHRPVMTAESVLLDCFTDPSGVMIRRSAMDHVGRFAECADLLYVEDHDMWLRLLEVLPGAYVPEHGYCYRLHSQQVSLNPVMWNNAKNVLAKASARYPYSRQVVRKQRAVLAYRHSQIAHRERRYLRATVLLAKAAICDPARAIVEVRNRFKTLPPIFVRAFGTR